MTIIWDWNGTLLDDAEMAVRVTNEVFTRYGYGTMDLTCYRERFCFPVKDYYLACGVPGDAFPVVGKAWSDAYVASFPGTPLRQDSAETVRRFQAAGLHQLILSASKRELLAEQVSMYPELAGMFDVLLGIDDIYAGGKVQLAKDFMARSGLATVETVFIGDSTHDAEVAAAVGCRCLLVTGGHQCEQRLLTAGVPVLHSLREAADLLLG